LSNELRPGDVPRIILIARWPATRGGIRRPVHFERQHELAFLVDLQSEREPGKRQKKRQKNVDV
jgi:hypothetical protein